VNNAVKIYGVNITAYSHKVVLHIIIPEVITRDKSSTKVNLFCSFSATIDRIFLKVKKLQTTVSEAINPANRLNKKAGLCVVNFDTSQPKNVNSIEPGGAVNPRQAAAAEY
jgi:hypothetical protein